MGRGSSFSVDQRAWTWPKIVSRLARWWPFSRSWTVRTGLQTCCPAAAWRPCSRELEPWATCVRWLSVRHGLHAFVRHRPSWHEARECVTWAANEQMNVLKEDISRRAQGRSQQALTMSLFTVSWGCWFAPMRTQGLKKRTFQCHLRCMMWLCLHYHSNKAHVWPPWWFLFLKLLDIPDCGPTCTRHLYKYIQIQPQFITKRKYQLKQNQRWCELHMKIWNHAVESIHRNHSVMYGQSWLLGDFSVAFGSLLHSPEVKITDFGLSKNMFLGILTSFNQMWSKRWISKQLKNHLNSYQFTVSSFCLV